MRFHNHLEEFGGLPTEEYSPDFKGEVAEVALRFTDVWNDEVTLAEKFQGFLDENPKCSDATAIVIGYWESGESPQEVVSVLIKEAGKLPNLRALFMGDIISEENEISWIEQTDYTELLNAYPGLEDFRVRGSGSLGLGPLRHISLKTLVFESGGLSAGFLNSLSQCVLPSLEHLELYLGDPYYGWNGTIETLAPYLGQNLFPQLKYLGLRDSVIADEICQAICESPILDQVEVLDLSLGALGDAGAECLLSSSKLTGGSLKKLDLHFHYLSQETMKRLADLPLEVDVRFQQNDSYEHRYVAVTE